MNYLMSFFIWIVLAIGGLTVFHVEWWKMLFFFLIGCGVECAVEQSVMIILYTNDKLPQKLIKGICFGMKVFLIAFTLMIVLYFKENSECNLYCDLFGVYGVHCCGGVQNEM